MDYSPRDDSKPRQDEPEGRLPEEDVDCAENNRVNGGEGEAEGEGGEAVGEKSRDWELERTRKSAGACSDDAQGHGASFSPGPWASEG